MPFEWGTIGAVAAPLVGGALQFLGAGQTNQANRDIATQGNEFQERMSNTAHQREVADLIAAGLNPILSVNKGASSPSALTATMQNPYQGLAASVQESVRLHNERDMQNYQKESISEDISNKKIQNQLLQSQVNAQKLDNQMKQLEMPTSLLKSKASEKMLEAMSNSAKLLEGARDAIQDKARIKDLEFKNKINQFKRWVPLRIENRKD